MKSLKRIVSIVIWTVVALYLAVVILLHIPYVQQGLGSFAAGLLADKLGTEVKVGRVDLGFVNRLIVDDVYVYDQKGKQMLRVARLSVKIDPSSIVHRRLSFSSSQFFGLQAALYQERADLKPNFQFVLDSLQSKDKTKPSSPIDLQVNSLIIRQGAVSFRRMYKPATPGLINVNDLSISKLSGHIVLNRLTGDSINLKVKKLSFEEKSGLSLKSLSFAVEGSRKSLLLRNFRAEFPRSLIALGDIRATYRTSEKGLVSSSLKYEGTVDEETRIVPADFSFLSRPLGGIDEAISLSSAFTGTGDRLHVSRLDVNTLHDILSLHANASLRFSPVFAWQARVSQLSLDAPQLQTLFAAMGKPLPDVIARLGRVGFTGDGHGGNRQLAAQGHLTTQVGQMTVSAEQDTQTLQARIETDGWQLGKMLDNEHFGTVSAQLSAKGRDANHLNLNGLVSNFDYNGYNYQNIHIDGLRSDANFSGTLQLDDPNAQLSLQGAVNTSAAAPSANVQASVRQFSPQALRLSDKWRDGTFSFDLTADITGSSLNTANGTVEVSNFLLRQSEAEDYAFDRLTLTAGYQHHTHVLSLDSDFGTADISGHFDYVTLPNSIFRLLGSKLPTLPGLPHPQGSERNDFQLTANFSDTRWMDVFLGIPLQVNVPLQIDGQLDDTNHQVDILCSASDFLYAGARYKDASLHVSTPNDTLKATASVRKVMDNGKIFLWKAALGACDNRLSASVSFRDNKRHPFKGTVNAVAQFRKDSEGRSTAYIDVNESAITLGDTTWSVRPSSMVYRKGLLAVSNFRVEHGSQFIAVDGQATENVQDTLTARLNGVDVRYVLDLVNFHSVDFDGLASGRAYVAAALSSRPRAAAALTVDKFLFEGGRMGVLSANVNYNDEAQQIDVDAVANDSIGRRTLISGFVSPKHKQIDLGITAENTRLEFMESFCGSFLNNIEAKANGSVRLFGPLSNINLKGQLVVDGSLSVTSLNTTYTLRGDTVRFIPDEIIFSRDTLYDRNGNIGIVDGSVHHRHLSNLSYDLNVAAENLLSYNTHTFGSNTFYGTAYATGTCGIHGKSGEVTIDIDATPNPGSIIVYNVGGVGDLSDHEFLKWVSHKPEADSLVVLGDDNLPVMPDRPDGNDDDRVATDIRLNFLINCNPDATIKLIMDEATGDYITLNGDGVLRATYFNKGSFDLYGNYIVDHGLYKLTIQNVIKKDFEFQRGGTIAFGGDPYNADLQLKANYTLNSVSLSDLNIGRSFTSNNIRVNCLMNITGTPFSPKVDFDIDLPTLGNDVKQMVYSVLNAEEEMNQQVLYLLAVGRFYTQGNNNAASESASQYSQTSLAMQSILSGTISQQLNNVLSQVVNSSNWNFGANISTGTEGFNDAEYEGLLSGRMLNNRLIFNGQFGYRDNANATTGFIGDFDLRYLLFPNGNLSINVYNKTNDRYFTRNTLTTQGIGLIMKKDFNGLRDLFGLKKRKNRHAAKDR